MRGPLLRPTWGSRIAWPGSHPQPGEQPVPISRGIRDEGDDEELEINPVYVRASHLTVPRHRLGEHGLLPDTALQTVRDELVLDGNARLNLATFVTTWMEPQATQLMTECLPKNMIDKDEYPQTAEIESRCVSILPTCGTRRQWRQPPAPRPPARARRACWAAWPCCGAGGSAGSRPAWTPAGRTW